MRSLLIALAALALLSPLRAEAQDTSVIPTPGPEEIVFVGQVPVAAGAVITLRVMDLDVGIFSNCGTATTYSAGADATGTSTFAIVASAGCLAGAEGAVICWDKEYKLCAVVAAVPGSIPNDVPSLADVGVTVDTGLLSAAAPIDPDELIPPEPGDGVTSPEVLPPAGSEFDKRTDEQAWLLWTGLAALSAGLVIGAGLFVAARRR
jgi:hypothetical protein